MKELFSVSMCVYGKDNPVWFEEAVESILNQTVCPAQIVLVVDGPVPEQLNKVISKYENNPLFKILRIPENTGHGNARRVGLSLCEYDLVALMDADDISRPTRFQQQLELFQKEPKLSIVGGNIAEFVGDSSNFVGYRMVPTFDAEIKEYLKKRCPFNQVTVMFRKSCVEQVGGYLDWYCNEDYYLWIRMRMADMHFSNVPDVLVNVRVGEDMYQRRGGWRYFVSEAKLQKFMFDNRLISRVIFWGNIAKRIVVQVLLPNRLRGWVFQKFARENIYEYKEI